MPIKQRIDLQTISECVVAEITSGRKKMFLVVLYRSPSQTSQEFGDFLDGFETMVTKIKDTKPHCLVITGDFNCKSIKWWADGDENAEGIELNELTDSLDLSQLVDKPTHFLENSESCIDLIFTDQPNLLLNSGTHPSLFESCHHDIIHGSVNLNIPSPPPFKRRVWKYDQANVESLKSDMLQINWENEFRGCNCTEATDIFTKKFLSLCSSHIPNFEIRCNPKDPPWITDVVKEAIRRKHRVHRKFLKNGRNTSDRDRAKAVRNETTRTIEQAKERYFCDLGQKLCDPSRGVKAYWETIHKILNRKKVMKSLHGLTNSYESALLTRLCVHFLDLNEHRFDHNFACESPNCKCNVGVESTIHYFLHCHLYRAHWKILLDEVSDIVGNDISQLPDDHLCDLLLFGSKAYNEKANEMILKCTAKFAKLTKRFR